MQNSKMKPMCFRLPAPVIDKLQEAKWIERKSMTEIVTQAISEYCARHNIPEPDSSQFSLPESSEIFEGLWRE